LPKKKIAHARLPAPSVRDRRPDVPEGLAAVLDRMLAKEPAQRFATPQDVVAALGPFTAGCDCRRLVAAARDRAAGAPAAPPAASGETVGYDRPTPPFRGWRNGGRPSGGLPRKRWGLVVGVGLAVVAAVVLVLSGGWGPGEEQKDSSDTGGRPRLPPAEAPGPQPGT